MNRAYCKEKGIRLSGPKLGRPKKDNSADKRQEYIDSGIRNGVEGKFGEAKRAYGLDLMKVRLADSSKTIILMNLLVLNLEKRLWTLFAQIELKKKIGIKEFEELLAYLEVRLDEYKI